MNWQPLNNEQQLDSIRTTSYEHPVVIFKHSTRCSISASALNRLERSWNDAEMKNVQAYFLDLLSYRPISDKIAVGFGIEHQSPQVLLMHNGQVVYDVSHMDIRYDDLKSQVNGLIR
jgi:bacillithiol system protein YtxJ